MNTFQTLIIAVATVMIAEVVTVNIAKMVQMIVESRKDA